MDDSWLYIHTWTSLIIIMLFARHWKLSSQKNVNVLLGKCLEGKLLEGNTSIHTTCSCIIKQLNYILHWLCVKMDMFIIQNLDNNTFTVSCITLLIIGHREMCVNLISFYRSRVSKFSTKNLFYSDDIHIIYRWTLRNDPLWELIIHYYYSQTAPKFSFSISK